MKFQKLGAKVFSGVVKLGSKGNQEKFQKFGQKAMHTAKSIESGLSDDNIEKYQSKAKDIGSRITEVSGKAADISEKVGKVARAVGLKEVGDAAMKFSSGARQVNERGKKAGEILGY